MAYKAVFRADALREFEHLTQGQQKAIARKIDAIQSDPFTGDSIELDGFAPLRRIKSGDARRSTIPNWTLRAGCRCWRSGPIIQSMI
jgi:hypothetical protein